jgi:cation:H+ antiporter
MTVMLLVLGFAGLLLGAELLVRAAVRLSFAMGLSPLVVGLTVVAFGTSAPEMAATIVASTQGRSDLAFGNVLGSNTFNVLFILGLSAAITPLVVAQKLVRIDVPLMIGMALIVSALALDGRIARFEGMILLVGLIAYIVFAIRRSPAESPEVQEAYERQLRRKKRRTRWRLLADAGWFLLGLGLLVGGSRAVVAGAVALARALGISELLVGLTVIAVGTSLPEVATSLLAALRGHRDIAAGNVIGSNIFNLLGVLGLAGVLAPKGVVVSRVALTVDLPVMLAACVACLPIFVTGYRISRGEGVLLFAHYMTYATFLGLDAIEHPIVPLFRGVMLFVVIPLSALTLLVIFARTTQRRRPGSARPGGERR